MRNGFSLFLPLAQGDQCKFDHDAEIEKKKEMCKFYVQGYCTRGENCLYLHNEYPCKFYHTGAKCYQGEYCKFSHAPLTDGLKSCWLKFWILKGSHHENKIDEKASYEECLCLSMPVEDCSRLDLEWFTRFLV